MGSRYRLTTIWAILSETVGIPNGSFFAHPSVCPPVALAAEHNCPMTSDSRSGRGCCSDPLQTPRSFGHRRPPHPDLPSLAYTPPILHAWRYKTVLLYPRRSSPCGLPTQQSGTTSPLRSSPITGLSTLLRATPPLCPASVLSPSRMLSAWVSPFASGRQVPTFLTKA